jgi:hypothetical protein
MVRIFRALFRALLGAGHLLRLLIEVPPVNRVPLELTLRGLVDFNDR